MGNNSVIRCENISFQYTEGSTLFSDVSLSINPGGFYLVRGPSGSGKSSFLRLMNRLEEPSQGTLYFKGIPFSEMTAPELRRQVLYIQQTPIVTDGSVKDNLLMPFTFKNNRTLPLPDDSHLRGVLDEFSMEMIPLDKQARNLSVGQQQRLCLIRGLLLSPSVILLDEPTSSLDDESSLIVENMAESLCLNAGKTIIMISHRGFRPHTIKPTIIEVKDGRLTVLPQE
ncbi:MAG: ATP-binding cassette domain-containing protein [Proteobacteria bacterium]|nr:ATP-binding cassette domain-containing protein [Pseudomonadota bacterium]